MKTPWHNEALAAIDTEMEVCRQAIRDAQERLDELIREKDRLLAQAAIEPTHQETDRDRLSRDLESRAAAAGPGDPPTCHNLGLFALAESNRHLQAGDLGTAVSWAERAVAHLAVALTDPDYLLGFVHQRGVAYDRNLGAEEVATLDAQAAARVAEYLTDLGARAGAEDLPLVWRVELRVARLLRNLGGFPPPGHGERRVGVGPTYVRLRGLNEAVSAFLPSFRAGPALKEELELLFSPLSLAVALARDGQSALALERVRAAAPGCRSWPEQLRGLACRLELELLMRLAGDEMASVDAEEMMRGVVRLREALGLDEAVHLQARDLVFGRARVLGEQGRFDVALHLLEVADWCDDDEVQGLHARLLTDRGIVAGNAGRWPEAVDDLRRACRLAPHNARAEQNLVVALGHLANSVWQETDLATALYDEAIVLARKHHEQDPENVQARQTYQDLVQRRKVHVAPDIREDIDSLLGDLWRD